VATGSVRASEALSEACAAAGVGDVGLVARHGAAEAEGVARAGGAGAVTGATPRAGRGTDSGPGPGGAARGGLHVLCCQDNPSARLERQVIGRAGRQGEPVTAEVWRALDAPAWQPGSGWAAAADRWLQAGRLAPRWFAWRQSRQDALQFRLRRAEIEQDLHWQHRTGRSPNHED
ncbi:MAG: hypothetical protein ACK57B_00555, partial [Betaproteobacteria bacterium]